MVELYNQMVATIPEVVRRGKTMPYTSLNGNMFSFLSKDGKISLRFNKTEQAEFMEEHQAELSIQYNSVMQGYAVVPETIINDSDLLYKYFRVSYENAKTLKPKPTKKSPKKK